MNVDNSDGNFSNNDPGQFKWFEVPFCEKGKKAFVLAQHVIVVQQENVQWKSILGLAFTSF